MIALDVDIADVQYQLAVCMTRCTQSCASLDSFDDLTRRFRSNSLGALAAAVFPDSCHTRFSPNLIRHFQRFTTERQRLAADIATNPEAEYHRDQSLLIVNWEASLFDGAVVPETRGFIDDDYIPGWDSWLSIVPIHAEYETHGLLCWVPQSLADEVDSAIRIDPACCMAWCYTAGQQFHHHLWGKGFMEH